MTVRPRRAAGEREEDLEELSFGEPPTPPEAPRPVGGYRVSGDIEVRSKELEQDLVVLRGRYKALEREVWAARKSVRRTRSASALSKGGVGATIAALFALLLYAFDVVASPPVLLGMVIVGYLLGAIAGMRWRSDDDGFPPAPDPRLP